MDVELLLQGVIRLSNFMSSRLIVSGVFFYVISGFTEIGSVTEGFLPNLELVNEVIQNYQDIFNILGVSEFALLLIFFLFLTAIHITYIGFDRVGEYVPPAIVPLAGWEAIEDMTSEALKILHDARGEEHTDEENQRLYEFKKKLAEIDEENEKNYAFELTGTYAAFRISKSMSIFVTLSWFYAVISGKYTGDTNFLLLILSLTLLVFLFSTIAIFRAHHFRISDLRDNVVSQFIGFSSIWTPIAHQEKVAAACAPSQDLSAASFRILMPVYGTLDVFFHDLARMRGRISQWWNNRNEGLK